MSYSFIPGRMYRMPVHFGPSIGPRQGPDGRQFDWSDAECDIVAAHYRSDREAIEKLLPPRFELFGEPIVSVAFSYNRNLPWLAGRGYNTLGFRVPVQFNGSKGPFVGSLLLVLWEDMADPITTGREELGFSKLYCDLPPARKTATSFRCDASWEGFRFFELELTGLELTDQPAGNFDPSPKTGGEIMHYRYHPRTGDWGNSEFEQITSAVHGGDPALTKVLSTEVGKSSVTFNLPSWEDMPTQQSVIHGLASMPRLEMLGGYVIRTKGSQLDLYNQRIVE
jgi:hypothetical protein